MTSWHLTASESGLRLRELTPRYDAYLSPGLRPQDHLFEKVTIQDLAVGHGVISFAVTSADGVYREHYDLRHISAHEITGCYAVSLRSGDRSQYIGRLILERLE